MIEFLKTLTPSFQCSNDIFLLSSFVRLCRKYRKEEALNCRLYLIHMLHKVLFLQTSRAILFDYSSLHKVYGLLVHTNLDYLTDYPDC